jgi:hypothetical protein
MLVRLLIVYLVFRQVAVFSHIFALVSLDIYIAWSVELELTS